MWTEKRISDSLNKMNVYRMKRFSLHIRFQIYLPKLFKSCGPNLVFEIRGTFYGANLTSSNVAWKYIYLYCNTLNVLSKLFIKTGSFHNTTQTSA